MFSYSKRNFPATPPSVNNSSWYSVALLTLPKKQGSLRVPAFFLAMGRTKNSGAPEWAGLPARC